ncbi:hypothetical protein BLOT_007607 [Blomia tropicalis]|nr:hypothetical protein BLOT_007607 [Blomia tropicalis]
MYSEEYSTIEPSQSEQLYPKSSSGKTQSCRKTLQIAGEVVIEPSCVTGKVAYYALSSILAIGILMLVLIPIGSTFLYIDYKQQLAQRKSNKNDLCKSKCSFGADCIIDDYTNQPFCRCPLSCTDDYEPVCGKIPISINYYLLNLTVCIDQMALLISIFVIFGTIIINVETIEQLTKFTFNSTYRFDSCNKQQPISVLTNGACEPTNQCDNVTCHRYQKCQVNEHGKAQCVCAINTNCNGNDWKHHQQQQQQQPGNETYCGVNDEGYNRNFANICELECLQENFKVLHRGQCGQCTEQCQHHSECKLNEFGVPTCMCQSVCERPMRRRSMSPR